MFKNHAHAESSTPSVAPRTVAVRMGQSRSGLAARSEDADRVLRLDRWRPSERYTCGGFGASCGETTHLLGRPLSSCRMRSSYQGDSIVGRSLPVHRTPPCRVIGCSKSGKAAHIARTCVARGISGTPGGHPEQGHPGGSGFLPAAGRRPRVSRGVRAPMACGRPPARTRADGLGVCDR
jgi:hypothetical protein